MGESEPFPVASGKSKRAGCGRELATDRQRIMIKTAEGMWLVLRPNGAF